MLEVAGQIFTFHRSRAGSRPTFLLYNLLATPRAFFFLTTATTTTTMQSRGCFICHEQSHISPDCPYRGDGRKDKHNGCYVCGSQRKLSLTLRSARIITNNTSEHRKGFHHPVEIARADEPEVEPDQRDGALYRGVSSGCFICHHEDHYSPNCPYRQDGRKDKHGGCYVCGDECKSCRSVSMESLHANHSTGHRLRHHKAEYEKRGEEWPFIEECGNCRSLGHITRHCPAKQKREKLPDKNEEVSRTSEDAMPLRTSSQSVHGGPTNLPDFRTQDWPSLPPAAVRRSAIAPSISTRQARSTTRTTSTPATTSTVKMASNSSERQSRGVSTTAAATNVAASQPTQGLKPAQTKPKGPPAWPRPFQGKPGGSFFPD